MSTLFMVPFSLYYCSKCTYDASPVMAQISQKESFSCTMTARPTTAIVPPAVTNTAVQLCERDKQQDRTLGIITGGMKY